LAIGRKKGGGFFLFFVEKEKPKIKKKNEKYLSFFGLHFLVARVATREEEKKAISSLPNYFSSGPSVVEEDLEDLEDLHHHMVMFKKETTIS
tara:strand:+ start:278 stop:553 length:276 start_codon:yes stop_codon:yes gene_type:complete